MRMVIKRSIVYGAAIVLMPAWATPAPVSAGSLSGSEYRVNYDGDAYSTFRLPDGRHRYSSNWRYPGRYGFYFGTPSYRNCDRQYGWGRCNWYGSRYVYPRSSYRSRNTVYGVTINPGAKPKMVAAIAEPPRPAWATGADAWTLLARGESRSAAARFAVAAIESPGDPDARVGYALAMAADGDLGSGAWALRRAFFDNRDVAALPADRPQVVALAHELIGRYDTAVPVSAAQRVDYAFAPAALRYLAGDARSAAVAASALTPDPPAENAVGNLRRLATAAETGPTPAENR